jgi:hypothetical protein
LDTQLFIESSRNNPVTGFGEIVAYMLDVMRYHFRARGLMRSQATLPVITSSQTAGTAGLMGLVILSGPDPDLTRIQPESYRPEYALRVFWRPASRDSIAVRLEKSGEILGLWDETITAADLVEKQKDLAYRVLIFLKEYIENEHARGDEQPQSVRAADRSSDRY